MGEFIYEKDVDGIVIVIMNMDGLVNVMSVEFRLFYVDMVNKLEVEVGLEGVILILGKDMFFVGGDLKWLVMVKLD